MLLAWKGIQVKVEICGVLCLELTFGEVQKFVASRFQLLGLFLKLQKF